MSKFKVALTIVISLLLCICIGINGWYLYVYLYGSEKLINTTFNVSTLTATKSDGTTETQYFMTLNIYDNLVEVMFYYYTDENQENLYSQGVQYYGNIATDYLLINQTVDEVSALLIWNSSTTTNYYYTYSITSDEIYYYMSGDNYETTLLSTDPVDDDTYYLISMGGDDDTPYFMQLKHNKDSAGSPTDIYSELYDDTKDGWAPNIFFNLGHGNLYYKYYYTYGLANLIYTLYNSCSTLEHGTSHAILFEMGDLFDYYQYNSEKQQYELLSTTETAKVKARVQSYYTIEVTIHDGDCKSASDSIFNCIAGNSNYTSSIEDDDIDSNYYMGYTTINVDYTNFDYVNISGSSYALKLKSSFVDFYLNYKNDIVLNIEIDLDILSDLGIEFYGFTADSGLSNFNILSCHTIQTQDEIRVTSEVSYE